MSIAGDTGTVRYGRNNIAISYSRECSLKEKGLDGLFCNINANRAKLARQKNISWKMPNRIAESVKAAYAEEYTYFTVTGGLIPECWKWSII